MEIIKCKWCNENTKIVAPIDYFGFSGHTCESCGRSVDEGYRDWFSREEWANGSSRVRFASGLVVQSGSVPDSERPLTIFSRSTEDALRDYPQVVMYPDSGGYTGIAISPSEARFFVFGRLFKHISLVKNVGEVFLNWRPTMDEILLKYKILNQQGGRRGTHIDEIVDADMKTRLKGLMGESV